ncbi:MAG: hypothetical protein B7X31_10685 [Thiomonas sp. 13-66-29]|jgi:acyl carrier protein|nr:MAG: hypothetical protein B7X31_10685 [Thiomonas sp. 13-66-29]
MNRPSLLQRICEIITQITGQAPVSDVQDTTRLFDDLGLDSVGLLELLVTLESALGIEIDPDDLTAENVETLGTVADYVEARLPETQRS